MSTRTMADMIGQTGTIDADGFRIPVRIDDARMAFGRTDVLVTPIHGSGTRWVDASRVALDK